MSDDSIPDREKQRAGDVGSGVALGPQQAAARTRRYRVLAPMGQEFLPDDVPGSRPSLTQLLHHAIVAVTSGSTTAIAAFRSCRVETLLTRWCPASAQV